ncbi:hypothetical protein ACIRST_38335 [Kitasatospora sp. NPDC101447]|uniref:hypothetical protein n=1 Tax=Kitasatospora sp. NPDC101447 TaxID=3364102 RepID=UPI0038089685
MKVRYIEFEGTPEELDASELVRSLIAAAGSTVSSAGAFVKEQASQMTPGPWRLGQAVPGVADEGQAAVTALLAKNPAAAHFVAFLREACSWENAEVFGIRRRNAEPQDQLDYSAYLRLRKVGSQYGGFAYVWAETGRINLRLNYDKEPALRNLAPDAFAVHTGHREYRVSIDITDEDTLRQALVLALAAYDRT